MNEIQTRIRTTLTRYKYHHPKAAVERTMLSKREGGRGLLDIAELSDRQILGMRKYFWEKQKSSQLIKAVVQADF